MDEILVEEYRGDLLECVHRGHVVIVSDDGEVKYTVGDVNFEAYLRSSAKPIQLIPLIKYEIDKKFNFNNKEIAVMTGSHRAESFHVEALESIMKKIGVEEEQFVCLPTYPLGIKSREVLIRENKPKRAIYHNCSGKHLGIMSLCKHLNCSLENYWDINNGAQQEILKHISLIADYPKEKIKIGVDGCGVPVFAMPIKYLAKSYMRLACPDLIEDKEVKRAVEKITSIMNENYEMVSGTGKICSILLEDSNIVAKGGAKGVYCFGLREERLGIAIKVMDGSEEEWPLIVASILEQINYKNKATIKKLYDVFPVQVKNDNNRIVGMSEVKFKLV